MNVLASHGHPGSPSARGSGLGSHGNRGGSAPHSCHFPLACPCRQDPLHVCWGLMCSAGKSPVEVEPVWKGKQGNFLQYSFDIIFPCSTPL